MNRGVLHFLQHAPKLFTKFRFIELLQTTHVILSKAKDPFSSQENTDSSLRFGMTVKGRYCSINRNLKFSGISVEKY